MNRLTVLRIVLVCYILFMIYMLAYSVIVLHKIAILHWEEEQRDRVINLVRGLVSSITALAGITCVIAIPLVYGAFTQSDPFVRHAAVFFGVRAVLLLFSTFVGWTIYRKLQLNEQYSALRWVFVLENISLVMLVLCSVSLLATRQFGSF